MEKGGGTCAVGSLIKAKVPTVKNLIQKYSHDIPCYSDTLLTLVRARLYRCLHLCNDIIPVIVFAVLEAVIAGHVYQYTSLFKTLGSLIGY